MTRRTTTVVRRSRVRGSSILGLIAIATLTAASASAQQPPPIDPDMADDGLYVVVEATHRPLDGAVVIPPKCKAPRAACALVADVLHNDLHLSGVVRALDLGRKARGIEKSAVPNFDVRRDKARAAGVTWAVGVAVRKQKGNKRIAEVEVQVRNVKTGAVLNLGKRAITSGPFSKLRQISHRVANAIFGGLTGVEGSFDDHLFYSSPGPTCARCIWRADGDGTNARVIVGDKGIHMLPRPTSTLGVLYVSFRGDLPSLFRLGGPALNSVFDSSGIHAQYVKEAAKKPKSRRSRGKKKGGSPDRPAALPTIPKLPARSLKPFASHAELQYRTATEAADGRIVATINDGEQADLWLLDRSGRRIRNLTNHEADDLDPSWAPDGQRVAFVSNRSGRPQIYVVRLDGTGLERMTFAGPYNTGPDWGPSGKIVYSGLRGGAVDILTVDDKKQMQRLTPGKGRRSLEPSWTSCGRRVLYVSDEDGGGPRMWVASHDGAVRQPLALPPGRYYTPVWRKKPGAPPQKFRP